MQLNTNPWLFLCNKNSKMCGEWWEGFFPKESKNSGKEFEGKKTATQCLPGKWEGSVLMMNTLEFELIVLGSLSTGKTPPILWNKKSSLSRKFSKSSVLKLKDILAW